MRNTFRMHVENCQTQLRKQFLDSSLVYFFICWNSSLYKILKTPILAVFQYNVKILLYLKCLMTLHDIRMFKSLLSHFCLNHFLFLAFIIANLLQFYSLNCILFVINLRFVQLNLSKCSFSQLANKLQIELFQFLTFSSLSTLFLSHLFFYYSKIIK